MNNKTTILILFYFLISLSINAQINGIIRDTKTQEGIAEAEIIDVTSGMTSTTNQKGQFSLDTEPIIGQELILFAEGYNLKTVVLDSFSNNYRYGLEPLEIQLADLNITSRKKEVFGTRKLKDIEGTSIFAGKKSEVVLIDLVNGNKAANVGRQMYAEITGLNIYEGSDGGVQLNIGGRGLDPNRTSNFNTRQNGYDISADVLGYPENYYTPPSESIEEIKILRGASSLQYGTQFGGLVDFKIRRIPRYRTWDFRLRQTVGSYCFHNTYSSIGYNAGKWSTDVFYNYKSGNGYRDNSDFSAHNAFVSMRYDISDNTQISTELTYFNYLAQQAGGLTDRQFAETPRLSTRERNWFGVDWLLYNIKLLHSFNSTNKIEISLFGLDAQRKSVGFRGDPSILNENPITGLDEVDANGNYTNPRDLIVGDFKNLGVELRYLKEHNLVSKKSILLAGVKYYNANNKSQQGPGSLEADSNFELQTNAFPDYANQSNFEFPNLNIAVFGENIFYIKDKLSITPGFRIERIKTRSLGNYQQVVFDLARNPIANERFYEERELSRNFILLGLGIDYKIKDKLKYRFNISENYRSVTFSDIRVVNPSFVIDEDITDEKGYTIETGISGQLDKVISFDINLYSILYNNRIGIVLDDRANRVRTNIGNAIISGTESLLNYMPINIIRNNNVKYRLTTFLNTAFTYSRYLDVQSNNVSGNKVEFIPSANIKSGLSFSIDNFKLSFQHTYLSQQYSDAQNSLASNNEDFRSGIIGEIPAYQIVDFSIQYKWKSIQIDAGINNLMDENYFTRRATGYPGPGIIPSDGRSFFVTLGYIFKE